MEKLPANAVIFQTSGADNAIGEGRRFMIIDEPAKIDPEAWKRLEAGVKDTTENMVDLADATRKAHEAIEQFGQGARVVAPYKPNRKQRRAQNKIRRSKEKKS